MPLRLDVRQRMAIQAGRVKSLDFHPTEPWLMISLCSGHVDIWDYKSDIKIKTLKICRVPVSTAKFVKRKEWVVAGCDDMFIRVFNYNSLDIVHSFKAHSDLIRCINVHPIHSVILSSGDDLVIKLWSWEDDWECLQEFSSHEHYIMQLAFDLNNYKSFISASLDTTLKVWNMKIGRLSFTLRGHEQGVNCVAYHTGFAMPYIISCGEDRCIKIWDNKSRTCVHTLKGHTSNVTTVYFHPDLPIVMTGSEDGCIKLWHGETGVLKGSFNFGYKHPSTITTHKETFEMAVEYNLGSILLKFGWMQPPISMDLEGEKIIYAKNNALFQVNLNSLPEGTEIKDGECLQLAVKDLGTCEIFLHTLSYNSKGNFFNVCGNGEYIVYTAKPLKNKTFGNGVEFVWASNGSDYAVLENSDMIKVYQNFEEKKAFEPYLGADGIFGGFMLAVRSQGGKCVSFYDWDRLQLIRRVNMKALDIIWSEGGGLLCLMTETEYYILKYNPAVFTSALANNVDIPEDGIKEVFELVGGVRESAKTGIWIGECFVYMNQFNQLNYIVGSEIVKIADLDRPMHILGYVANDNRLYLSDNDMNIVSYTLFLSVLKYQTAVMNNNSGSADTLIALIPTGERMKLAYFLEKQGFKNHAFAVSTDLLHKFELALATKRLHVAMMIAEDADIAGLPASTARWTRLSAVSANAGNIAISIKCCRKSGDFSNLLIYATTVGDKMLMKEVAEISREVGQYNVSFLGYFTLGELSICMKILTDAGRFPEAAMFARSYMPSKLPQMIKLWKNHLAHKTVKTAEEIANPNKYDCLFPNFLGSLDLDTFLKKYGYTKSGARNRPRKVTMSDVDKKVAKEIKKTEKKGFWISPSTPKATAERLKYEAESRTRRIDHSKRLLCTAQECAMGRTGTIRRNQPPAINFDMEELDKELKAMEDELGDDFFKDVDENDDDDDDDQKRLVNDGTSSAGLF